MRLPLSLDRRQRPDHTSDDARRRAELDSLQETALLLAERLDPESLLATIVERASELVGTEHGYLYLCHHEDETLTIKIGTGAFARQIGYRLRLGDGVAGRVAKTGEPLAVDGSGTWSDRARDLEGVAFQAAVAVPLRGARGVTGVIGLCHLEPGLTFGNSEIALLERFGKLAAIALDNARLYQSAQTEIDQRKRTEEELLDTVARLSRSELELKRAHEETIRRLADAAEFRDAETGRHTERMSRYCELLARRLGLDEERCDLIRVASPLHDIGKIAVPDGILLKAGPLTRDERKQMERHTEVGHKLLSGSSSELLAVASMIAWTHHERFDGKGYPRGLAGEAIPLEGRIAAIADVFDAITTDRVYRQALDPEGALALMRDGRGTQFDPYMLDLFLEALDETAAIAAETDERLLATAADLDEPTEAEPLASTRPDLQPLAQGAAERIDARRFKRACRTAEKAFERGHGRDAIDVALETLVDAFSGSLLASVYAVEHDRLWLVAQRGYEEVRDGFALEQGAMGRAVRTGTIQVVGDVRSDPDFIAATGGILCEAAVPIQAGGVVAGVLNVETTDAVLPREAGAALAPLASMLASRIDEVRAGLGSDVGELVRLCVHASSLRGIASIAEFATRTVGRLLQLESAQLDLRRDDDPRARLASFWRRHDLMLEPLPADELERLDAVEQTRVGVAYSIIDGRHAGLLDGRTNWVVSLPLRAGGATVGTLTGRLATREPAHDRLEAATLFAQHAAALIDVAYALRREQRAAVTDPLTGLLNRRGFEERFHEEIQRSARAERPVALILCDCDGLKTMNDVRGHEQGDALLELVASCFRTHKRVSDVAARYGGDEFALLLPDADLETAFAVAERLRQAVSEEIIAGFRPSGSFGVASFPLHGSTTADLLRVADDALYRAKQLGGDEVAVGPTV